jgi:hypothetical protein
LTAGQGGGTAGEAGSDPANDPRAAGGGRRASSWWQWSLGLAVSAVALFLAFRGVDLTALWQALLRANYVYVIPAILLIFVGQLGRARSWQTIIGDGLALRRVFNALNIGYLLNNVLPFRLGEFGRALIVSRAGKISPFQAASTVVVERVVDLCMIVGMLAAFLPLVLGQSETRNSAIAFVGVTVLALSGLFVLARSRDLALRIVRAVFGRFGLATSAWEVRIESIIEGLSVLRNPKRMALAAWWSFFAWLLAGLAAWLMLLAFRPEATVYQAFFVLVITGLGISLPSAPGGVGVWQFAVVLALSVFAVPRDQALAFALFNHLTHYVSIALMGAVALAAEGETLGHLAGEARALTGRVRA